MTIETESESESESEERLEPTYRPRKYVSVSTLCSYVRCPRKYFYEKNGLRQDTLSLNPEYGSAMHEAIPVALETESLEQSMDAFLTYWVDIEKEIEVRGIDAKKHNRHSASRTLQHFIFTHSGRKSIYKLMHPPEGSLEREGTTSPFEVPWAIDIGARVPLAGRLDGLCTHRDTGESWVWELKTTGRYLNSQFFDAHEMYTQNLTYALVSQTLDVPCAGVIIEGVLVHASKVDNQCQMIPIQPHHLEDVLLWLQRTTDSLLDAEIVYAELLEEHDGNANLAAKAFPKDFTGCTPYTHYYTPGWRCDFADLCRVPDWRALSDLYKVMPDHDFLKITMEGVDVPKPELN